MTCYVGVPLSPSYINLCKKIVLLKDSFPASKQTYDDFIELDRARDDIELITTRKQYEELMRARGSIRPSDVKLLWKCVKRGHIFPASKVSIQRGKGCKQCLALEYIDFVEYAQKRGDVIFNTTPEEFEARLSQRGKRSPSAVKMTWKCANSDRTFEASWDALHAMKIPTEYCVKERKPPTFKPITFRDIIELDKLRKDLELVTTHQEFIQLVKMSNEDPAARLKSLKNQRKEINRALL